MSQLRITRVFHFESAHALFGYDGKCRNVHGHSYRLEVTVLGEPLNVPLNPKNGMVIDFGYIKNLVFHNVLEKFDHGLILNHQAAYSGIVDALGEASDRIIFVDYQPTCENLLLDFVNRIKGSLPIGVNLFSMKLFETVNSFAEWNLNDQPL